MPAEDDISQNHEANLEEFYATYEATLLAYETAKAEALSLFDQIRQDILETISDETSENLSELDQKISEIAAAYEEAKYSTISQVIEQIQAITTLHEEALTTAQNLYQNTNSNVASTHQNAIAESQANEERVKILVDERKSDIQRELTKLFNQFSATLNNLHATYLDEDKQQKLDYQIARGLYGARQISTQFFDITTQKYIGARIRAKKGEPPEDE